MLFSIIFNKTNFSTDRYSSSFIFPAESFSDLEYQPIKREIASNNKALMQQLLSCEKKRFSGYLSLELLREKNQLGTLFFCNGGLIGGANRVHQVRRWYRQIHQYCPHQIHQFSPKPTNSSQLWDYPFLVQQVEKGHLLQSQIFAIIRGNLIEILFDCIQACQSGNRISDIQVTYYKASQKITTSHSVVIRPNHVLLPAILAWRSWSRDGLAKCSPNLAPIIQNADALWQQTSPATCSNLTQVVKGDRTLRDLAVVLKRHVILLTRSIMPYVAEGTIRLQAVPDITFPKRPLVAYLEDSRFEGMMMGQILEQTRYRFTSIQNPIQALPWLLEQKPDLIFLDIFMPILNGYEVCAQIRQISIFKDTPVIIVTSSDGFLDRVRAKRAGSSGFLAKPITSEKILATLQNYLPTPSSSCPFPQMEA